MSINIGLTAEKPFSCVVGFSGKIIDRENLKKLSCRIERDPGKGRPTKKERREIDKYL